MTSSRQRPFFTVKRRLDNSNRVDQKLRIGAYTLAASLLRSAPDQTMLDYLIEAGRDTDGRDDIAIAMAAMAEAAATTTPAKAGDEFHDLFIGVGRGELVPFGT